MTVLRGYVRKSLIAVLFTTGLNSAAFAQLAPSVEGLEADAGRGIRTERQGNIEMQQTCPQRVGDAWDLTNERAWNTIELGVQIAPENLQAGRFQLYTRYNCETPFERPRRTQD